MSTRFDRIDDDIFEGEVVPPPKRKVSVTGMPVESFALPTPRQRVETLGEPHTIPTNVEYELPADPRAWLYCEYETDYNLAIVCFTPIAYWRIQRVQIDCHVDHVLRPFLPECIGDELEESTFTALAQPYEVRQTLNRIGFQYDNDFSRFILSQCL
jgi:hypothetical protein